MSAFSNGTEWQCWSSRWCHTCRHDSMGQTADVPEVFCEIVTTAMIGGVTPDEWVEVNPNSLYDRYTCSEYEPREDEQDARLGTDGARWVPETSN